MVVDFGFLPSMHNSGILAQPLYNATNYQKEYNINHFYFSNLKNVFFSFH